MEIRYVEAGIVGGLLLYAAQKLTLFALFVGLPTTGDDFLASDGNPGAGLALGALAALALVAGLWLAVRIAQTQRPLVAACLAVVPLAVGQVLAFTSYALPWDLVGLLVALLIVVRPRLDQYPTATR